MMYVDYLASLGVSLEVFQTDLRVRQVQLLPQVLCMWMPYIQAALSDAIVSLAFCISHIACMYA